MPSSGGGRRCCRTLQIAALRNHPECIRNLIADGADVDGTDGTLDAALHVAAFAGSVESTKALVANGADVTKFNGHGDTPCHLAAFKGNRRVLVSILDNDFPINIRASEGDTALLKAAFNGHTDCCRELVRRGCDVNMRSADGDTALHKAAYTGSLRTVRLLLDSGADPNLGDGSGDKAIHKAAFGGHAEVCRRLVAGGADVDGRTQDGETALHKAAWTGRRAIVEVLTSLNANVDARDQIGDTPLCKASFGGFLGCVQVLLARGADPDVRTDRLDTALHKAAFAMNDDCLRVLLDCGADPSLHDVELDLPLHKAAFSGSVWGVRHLTGHPRGSELVDARNDRLQTPLFLAALNNTTTEAVVELLSVGADPSLCDSQGMNALHAAAQSGDRGVVEILLRDHTFAGARSDPARRIDINARDEEGLTALRHAFRFRNRGAILAIVAFLREHAENGIPDLEPREVFDLALSELPVGAVRFDFEVSRQNPLATSMEFLRLPPELIRGDVGIRFLHRLPAGAEQARTAASTSSPGHGSPQQQQRQQQQQQQHGTGKVNMSLSPQSSNAGSRPSDAATSRAGARSVDEEGMMRMMMDDEEEDGDIVETMTREGVQSGFFKEFIALLSRDLFVVGRGIFEEYDGGRLQPSPMSHRCVPPTGFGSCEDFFFVVGKFVGAVLYHGHLLPVTFTRPLIKRIRGEPVGHEDIAHLDPELHAHFRRVLDTAGLFGEGGALHGTTFSVDETLDGVTENVPLKPCGASVPVTEETKGEYVRLYSHHRVAGGPGPAIEHFVRGVHAIVPPDSMFMFSVDLLDATISGEPEIDVADWHRNTEFEGCTAESPQARWFFEILREMSMAERRALLMFCTSLSRVPVLGFSALQSKFRFVLLRRSEDALPIAFTCINAIHVPSYRAKSQLKTRLSQALSQPLLF